MLLLNRGGILPSVNAGSEIPDTKHLAVLPFRIIGDDPADKAFCDGLNEILVNRLTQVEQYQKSLLVIPTSEVMNQGITTVEEARKRFGITLAITGSFQRIGDTVRITQNLVDARTLRQLRADEITDQVSKAFALQDGIFSQTVRLLNIELDQSEQQTLLAGGTTTPGANEFYLQGRGYLQRYEDEDNVTSAMKLFQQAIQADPSFALAHAALGEASWRMYDLTKDIHWTEQAIRYCQDALALNDELSQVHITLAMVYNGQGKSEKALESIRTAREISPNDPRVFPVLAKIYESLGEANAAENAYKTAIQLQPDYWAGYNDLGIFYFRQGRFAQALKHFETVINLTPDNYIGYRNTGAIYAYQKQWTQAIQAFEKSIEIQPSYSALANIGTSYFYIQDYTNAITYFKQALEMEDGDYRIWGFLADSYYWGKDEKGTAAEYYLSAIRIAETQLTVNPDDTEILADIGAYYSMLQQKDKAISILEKLESTAITDISIMARMAETYENLHMRDEAMEWMVLAIEEGYTLAENQANTSLKNLVSDENLEEYSKSNP
jgi:serine/threonine-protein kinase